MADVLNRLTNHTEIPAHQCAHGSVLLQAEPFAYVGHHRFLIEENPVAVFCLGGEVVVMVGVGDVAVELVHEASAAVYIEQICAHGVEVIAHFFDAQQGIAPGCIVASHVELLCR